MKLQEHPRSEEFLAWMRQACDRAKPLAADLYRVAGPRRTTAADILSGLGAYHAGGRWNPKGSMRVVYLSFQPETALREANEHFRVHGLPLKEGLPKVVVAVRVEIDRMLDLTSRPIVKTLPEPMKNLMAENWRAIMARGEESATQALGRAAFVAGLQGLRVPSKPDPRGKNLLVFPERFQGSERLEVLNEELLDKLGRVE